MHEDQHREFVSGSIYLQEVLEGRAGQGVPKNKLNLLVSMQFNSITSVSLVSISLAFCQSCSYPGKLERSATSQKFKFVKLWDWLAYCWFARDVMAAMLVVKNKSISLLWELNSIFM